MRITKSVIKDLAIFMIGFGIVIGIAFPFFVILFGVSRSIALSPFFIIACVAAGAFVGGINILLSRAVVIRRLETTTEKMLHIKDNVMKAAQGVPHTECDFQTCQLKVDSSDAIGRNAQAYNQLVETLSVTMRGEELLSHLDIDTIVTMSLSEILRITDSAAGCIFIEKEGDLLIAATFGLKDNEGLTQNKIILSVASNHNAVHMKFPEDISIDGILLTVKPREILVEPLEFNGARIGVVLTASINGYESGSVDRLRVQLKSLSMALHNATIHEQIQELAAIDPLTGIYNRRFGLARLKDEMSRSYRNNSPLGVAMMDLDHFKRVNDNYGHLAGDKVLVSCAKIAKNMLREGDIILRYGGEEFLIILPGASAKDAFELTEKIRRVMEENVVHYGEFEIRTTTSIGITSIPENKILGQDELLSSVDEALYIAKESGRNRVNLAKLR